MARVHVGLRWSHGAPRPRDDRTDDEVAATSRAVVRQSPQGSGDAGAREHEQIRGQHGGAHVGVKAGGAFPDAPGEPEDPL